MIGRAWCVLKGETRKFKKAVRAAGLNDAIHFHSLRHTGASWLAMAGVPLFHIQRLLGHSSPAVTQIYAHLTDRDLQDAISFMQDPITKQLLSVRQFNSN
jgi:site-specific recombinase XerD